MTRLIKLGLLSCITIFPSGCDLIPDDAVETGSPELKRFASPDELAAYYRTQIALRNGGLQEFDRVLTDSLSGGQDDADGGAGDAPAPAAPTAEADGDHSNTTTQEAGVDESDVVKTDGDHLYLIDSDFSGSSSLRIVRTAPDSLAVLSETELEGNGQDLYLNGDRVVAITSGGGMFIYFGGVADPGVVVSEPRPESDDAVASDDGEVLPVEPDGGIGDSGGGTDGDAGITDDGAAPDIGILPPWEDYEYRRPFTVVTVIDVSDRGNPQVVSKTTFDGSPQSSRMIDGVLHLVLANYQEYYYDVMPMMGRPELDAADVDVADLLPDYQRVAPDGTISGGDLVTWENLFHPTDPDGFGLVTVVSMDTEDDSADFDSVGIVAEPGLIYSSVSSLYLTDTNYNWSGDQRSTTDIYKFDYDGASATPVATGTVPGRVLNQYSMGEHQGHLRVATTVDPRFLIDEDGVGTSTEPVNAVYVLGQSGEDLSVTGRVEDIAPGETIQSARFAGNRGYLVTFRQIDPLFTLDLSDPANPQVVGELKVPGFSTFLQPMGENHVLAVGQYVPPPGEFGAWGVQLSIFDVTDFANPRQSAGVVVGGDVGSYSEALWNPKAFTYFAERDVVALPISIYGRVFFDDEADIDWDIIEGETGISDGGGEDGVKPDEPPPSDDGDIAVDEPGLPSDAFEGLIVFRATAEDGFTELGRISTHFDEMGWWYPSFTRGVFVGERVYAVTNIGLRTAPLSDVNDVDGELLYGDPISEPPVEPLPTDPGVIDPMPADGGTSEPSEGATGG